MMRVLAMATFWLASTVALGPRAWSDSPDERFLASLRERRLFELAERYCVDQLARDSLTDARRAELTIELSRTWAEHAAESPPAQQPRAWQQARQVVDDFVAAHPRNPQVLLVRVQAALAALAQAELTLQEAELGGDSQRARETVRTGLRGAISQLRKLDSEINAQLTRSRSSRGDDAPGLSAVQLESLAANVRYQLARALCDQGLAYPPSSADRYNALTQATELLGPLAKADGATSLTWSSRLQEVTCLRLLEEYEAVERRLSALEKADPPQTVLPQLRAERIRLALACGQIDEALSESGQGGARSQSGWAEASYAQLEAYVAAWQRAIAHQDPPDAAAWEKRAVDQVRMIEQTYGPFWMRKAESLLARSIAKSPGSESPAALVRAAQSFYRGGQLDEALAAYDQAAARAREKSSSREAFQIAYAAATIEKERENFRSAIDRYRKLALAMPDHPQAAEAHLLAVYNAAQLAARQKPPQLDEYEKLLREHVATWPKSLTSSQAWWWLGRVKEHERAWPAAISALRNVRADHPQYPAAIAALGRTYEAELAEMRAKGSANLQLAKEAIRYFEQVIGPDDRLSLPENAAARAAALSAARIYLQEIPRGADQAERILASALRAAPADPPAWRGSLRTALVPVYAAQGRMAEAEVLLKQVPIGTTEESLVMVNLLAEYVERAPPDRKPKLAALELLAIGVLLARPNELDATTRQTIDRLRASMLAQAGRREEALEMMESIAKQNPRDGQAQEDLAALLSASHDPDDLRLAIAKWQEVIKKSRPASPRWFRAHHAVARAQLDLGEPTKARSTIRLAALGSLDWGGGEMKTKFQQLLAECERQAAQTPDRQTTAQQNTDQQK